MNYAEFVKDYENWRTPRKIAAEIEAANINFWADKFKVRAVEIEPGIWGILSDPQDTFPWEILE